jgi:hypothetical protein
VVSTSAREGVELTRELRDAEVLVTTPFWPVYADQELLESASRLKLVLTAGVGSDHVDLKAAAERGLQCGFCTRGFLCLLQQALDDDPEFDRDEQRLAEVLSATLCRCTGYTGIRRAAVRAARQLRGE